MISLYGLGQTSPHELALVVELGSYLYKSVLSVVKLPYAQYVKS